jgi:hypothetical protein
MAGQRSTPRGRSEERISDEKVDDHQHCHGAGGERFVRSVRSEQSERAAAQFERSRCQCSGNFAHRTGHREAGERPIGRRHSDHRLVGTCCQKCRAHEEIEGRHQRPVTPMPAACCGKASEQSGAFLAGPCSTGGIGFRSETDGQVANYGFWLDSVWTGGRNGGYNMAFSISVLCHEDSAGNSDIFAEKTGRRGPATSAQAAGGSGSERDAAIGNRSALARKKGPRSESAGAPENHASLAGETCRIGRALNAMMPAARAMPSTALSEQRFQDVTSSTGAVSFGVRRNPFDYGRLPGWKIGDSRRIFRAWRQLSDAIAVPSTDALKQSSCCRIRVARSARSAGPR